MAAISPRCMLFCDPLTTRRVCLMQKFCNHTLINLYKKDLSARSIARHLSAIRSLFHFLVADEKVAADPTEHLSSPKQWSTIPKFLNREQIEKLIAAPDCAKPSGLRDRAMLELLYATGIRVTELIQLRSSNLDLRLGVVRVTGKGNKQRIVPVHAAALNAISDYVGTGRPLLLKGKTSSLPFRDGPGRRHDPAGVLGQHQTQRQEGRHISQSLAARSAAYFCNPSSGRRRRPAQRTNDARSRRSFHH